MPPPHSPDLRRVNRRIWRACAGAAAQIPVVNSRVYYFPQGHMEHWNNTTTTKLHQFSHLVQSRPFIPCRIASVDLLADDATDEVFAKLLLFPIENSPNEGTNVLSDFDDGGEEGKITAFTKVLTPSDANNGGGFSVPRFCADTIFPPLNFKIDRPVQTLLIKDLHGGVWDFRHIYRGTPKRHLLTTGWSTFVNNKKLIAGDSVVFMRNLKGELFVGIRRAKRSCGIVDLAQWREKIGGNGEEIGVWGGESGRVNGEEVGKAVELAAKGFPFEVVYYPKAGLSDFVVRAEVVEAGMNVLWMEGMRVKMAVETDDSSRVTWFHGTVSSVLGLGNGQWRVSPWRSLQVTWDEPENLHHAKRVSPWQVEFVEPAPSLCSAFPLTKRFKVSQGSAFIAGGGEEVFPMTGFNNSTMRHLNSALLNYSSFPACMQGARQSSFRTSSSSNLINENTPKVCSKGFLDENVVPKLKSMSTELTIGSSNSSNLSPSSQSSGQSSVAEFAIDRNCGFMKPSVSTFKLFGKIIRMVPVNDSHFYGSGCTNDEVINGYNETENLSNSQDCSPTYTHTGLVDILDVRRQRTSDLKVSSL